MLKLYAFLFEFFSFSENNNCNYCTTFYSELELFAIQLSEFFHSLIHCSCVNLNPDNNQEDGIVIVFK